MRLDSFLVKKGYFDSRTKAKQSIERGEVFINDKVIIKSSQEIDEFSSFNVKIESQNQFVSLGGYKLQKAIDDFNLDCKDKIVADIGASTGGFTDCLLKNGAKKVFAIDLNDQLLHERLKLDNRVESIIKNAKELKREDFSSNLDLIVADLSFISLTKVLDIFSFLLDDGKQLLILIKPQFETGEKRKFKNGIIKDEKIRIDICKKIFNFANSLNFAPTNFTSAPINDKKNVEYLMLFTKNGEVKFSF